MNEMTRKIALSARDVWKVFHNASGERIEVLRGVSFSVGVGETIAIMGASGAGKTTLLHLIGGIERADAGTIELGDQQARARVAFVFQSHRLLLDLTAIENVALPLLVARCRKREAFARARAVLAQIGLDARAEHPIGHLSGGEQQRVAIARALVTGPRLVLADEPTGNLDEQTASKVAQLLIELCRRDGTSAVIATHNESLARLCDRALLLKDGRLSARDPL
ncbi:ABC-type antimicrobial peptide transport system, ATPase component [Pyrinomonas methylaliphatogenes]|uniref:ABC-type antimicrobial peptide transport system, ATPase component n=2 Tax=Pyrinomonas methylaliphatogenes TaxID=454194 RepID=A0A0B6X1V0_9BACT|nr:ABC-type antimicrobial peptide transport system, ATPase component [Pyrinomonas methylaliphatogenes]